MKTYLLPFCWAIWVLAPLGIQAQSEIPGMWKGTITQNQGGIYSSYQIEMYFQIQDGNVRGKSYVYVDDIFVEMDIEGILIGKDLVMCRDARITDSKIKEGLMWCLKQYQLSLKQQGETLVLEGFWRGVPPNQDCIPGFVSMQKTPKRA